MDDDEATHMAMMTSPHAQFKMGLNWASYFSGTLSFQFIQQYNKNSAQQSFPIFSPLTTIPYNQ
jgi:hypothetical protein